MHVEYIIAMYKEHPKTKRGPFCAAQIVARMTKSDKTKMIVCPGSDFGTVLNSFVGLGINTTIPQFERHPIARCLKKEW